MRKPCLPLGTLRPLRICFLQVQPIAGGPTFVPHPAGTPPVRLSGSAYWVLRLPFIYCGERGPLPRPTVPPPSYQQGKIMAPLIGLAD